MGKVRSEIKAAEKNLIYFYKNSGEDENSLWLRDNFSLLLSALKNGKTDIKKQGSEHFRVFSLCLKFLTESEKISDTAIARFFRAENLSLAEVKALSPLLFASAAVLAAQHFADALFPSFVKAIFALREVDFLALYPEISRAEALLLQDPAGVYPLQEEETKARYRKEISRMAKGGQGTKNGDTQSAEVEVLTEILRKAKEENRHIGFFLPLSKVPRGGWLFLFSEVLFSLLLTAALSFFVFFPSENALLRFVLCFFPFFFALFAALHPLWLKLSSLLFAPFFLPSLDPDKPEVNLPKTLVTVSSILPSAGDGQALYSHLKKLYTSHAGSETGVLLLLDKKNAKVPFLPSDKADLNAVKRTLDTLNAEFTGGFALCLRGRTFSKTEGEYTGAERKRGAIEALARQLRGGNGNFEEIYGDERILTDVKYILALDSDTALPFDALRKMLCVASHPLNESRYSCFAPRAESSLSVYSTLFSHLFTGGGLTAYSPKVSNFYMDAFGVGLFSGKGLLEVDAYLEKCEGAFPEGRVLSHDVLEGALLHTAFLSNCVVTEGFPSSPAAFYKRANRWIRGDVQNLIFLFGGLSKGKLSGLMKTHLFYNVCRALTPVFCLFLLLFSAFCEKNSALLLFISGILGVFSGALISGFEILIKQGAFTYFGVSLPLSVRTFFRGLLNIALLPYEAAVSLDAVIRAFWRTFISKKKTLQWTTAEAGEKGKKGLFYPLVIPLLVCLIALFGYAWHRIFALAVLLFIPFSLGDGVKLKRGKGKLSSSERRELRDWVSAMWGYFEENAGAENSYLPADNMQELPVKRTAKRTSPTNIGLYLACVLAAADMNIISPAEMLSRLRLAFGTLKKLERYKGLLYNWYDTLTLKPLPPFFVSTVDCGNYLVCLTALKEGLKSYPETSALIRDIEEELKNADVGALYSSRRRLFTVGFGTMTGEKSGSCYETYMSEMLLTSFYAVSKRLVPSSHFGSLSRGIYAKGGKLRAQSYTGTMFEYLMPSLFLPSFENTYRHEGLLSALYAQKKDRYLKHCPWGKSESGYYDFDENLNYAYRANGVKSLALKEDARHDAVFAPYASFLALSLDPKGAMKNLRRFLSLGAFGRNGFYEAVDFENRGTGEDYMTVRSYMAHHVGMSIIAAVNALRDNIFVRRFTADAEVSAALSLLEEKIPTVNTKRDPGKRRKEKREEDEKFSRISAEAPSAQRVPAVCYSDGQTSFIAEKNGQNRFLYGGISVFSPPGLRTRVKIGDSVFEGESAFYPRYVYGKCEKNGVTVEKAAAVLSNTSALAVPIKIKNNSKKEINAELDSLFFPTLEPLFFESEHPAFSDMSIRIHYHSGLSALTVRRIQRGKTTACVALGFWDFSLFSFETDREEVRDFSDFEKAFSGQTGAVIPTVAIRTSLYVRNGKKTEKVLLLCPGEDENESLSLLSSLRSSPLPDIRGSVKSVFSGNEGQWLAEVLSPGKDVGAVKENFAPLFALWEKGISGDLPLLKGKTDGLPSELISQFIAFHKKLRFSHIPTDLLLLTEREEDYENAYAHGLKAAVKRCGEEKLLNKPGGVHVVNLNAVSPAFRSALRAAGGVSFPEGTGGARIPPALSERTGAGVPLGPQENTFVPEGYYIGKTPPRPWGMTYSNSQFGTLLTNNSLGYTWALNARQNKLTPWNNDVTRRFTGEILTAIVDGVEYDLLENASVYFYTDRAVYGTKAGELSFGVRVETAPRGMIKRVRVSIMQNVECRMQNVLLMYRVTPYMADNDKNAHFVKAETSDGGLIFTNPSNPDYKGYLSLSAENGTYAWDGFRGTVHVSLSPGETVDFYLSFSCSGKRIGNIAALFTPRTRAPVSPARYPLLLHEALDTRVFARTFLYQCSGAYGFRDQLQDCMNLKEWYPHLLKKQILRSSSAQFPEGDVLHWFHVAVRPKVRFRGVRTRCSDDLLWLPMAVSEYIEKTGDQGVLSLDVSYLSGEELGENENERYGEYFSSGEKESVYRHCLRAIHRALRLGEHGLCLFGSCDWNDSFSEIGKEKDGESVWLTQFAALVCEKFSAVSAAVGDGENAEFLRNVSEKLKRAVYENAYNGEYFIRGFYEDGSPLGDRSADACKIDLLPQAFAVFAGIATADERTRALKAAFRALYNEKYKVLSLFYPPFSETTRRAGYVNDYPEGVRENGGQYTHAAVWFYMALKKEGLAEEAAKVLDCILPQKRYENETLGSRYKNEPYYLSADVYLARNFEGKGGWSGYTGAAGWLLRALSSEE